MLLSLNTPILKNLRSYLDQKPKRCLIFDFDETIFTLHLPWDVYAAELRRLLYVLNPSLAEIAEFAEFENEAVKRLGEQARTIRNEYSRVFERDHLSAVVEHKDLTEFIHKEHEKYEFFLWSSNMRPTIERELTRTQLLPLFSQLVCKDSVSLIKPDPEGFGLIFDPSKYQLEDYLMIGNSHHDQAAAEAAGIDFFLVKHKT